MPTSQAAAMGSPTGLIRSAITSRMTPFFMEYVTRTASPSSPITVLDRPNIKAEQYSIAEQIQADDGIGIVFAKGFQLGLCLQD